MLNLGQGTEVVVDFSENADGMPLFGGMYVENAWDKYGLTLSAMGGLGTAPRLFDTSNPRGPDGKGGDSDLGSPNNGCYPPGPGVGGGGEPGMPGENCNYQGNVLIIQENNNNPNIPDDNEGGGTIAFNFSQSTQFVAEIGLMDIDKLNSKIIIVYEGEVGLAQKTIDIPVYGDNSVQTLPINIANVRQLLVNLKDSGAVTFIKFTTTMVTPAPTSKPTPTPAASPTASPTTLPTALHAAYDPTVTPTASPTPDCQIVAVDFLTSADGTTLSGGDYVDTEWAAYGITLSATGGYGTTPRLFNTSDVGDHDSGYGDRDLGSPNRKCDVPGPGEGKGGEPGQPGENCDFVGNVLIIQEDNGNPTIPDDNRGGGVITFDFSPPATYVYQIGLMDVEEATTSITVVYDGGEVTLDVPPLGDNSVQTLTIDIENVSQLKLNLTGSGAVTFLSFCPAPTPEPTILPTTLPTASPTPPPDGLSDV
jgi:hypothetical protein